MPKPTDVSGESESLKRVTRPWGSFETHAAFSDSNLKTLHVNPGARLSLQSHAHRSEIWLLLTGGAQATCGPDVDHLTEVELVPGEAYVVPVGTVHRIASREGCVIAEVAYGTFDEDDIIRYADDFGRVS